MLDSVSESDIRSQSVKRKVILMKNIVCAVLGSKLSCLPFGYNEEEESCILLKDEMREKLLSLIEKENVREFILSLGLTTSLYAAEIIISLKANFPDLKLECVIPFENLTEKWCESLRNRYFNIAELSDKEILLEKRNSSDNEEKLNTYLLNSSNLTVSF